MKRKFTVCVLIVALVLLSVGCGNQTTTNQTTTNQTTTNQTTIAKVPGVTTSSISLGAIVDVTGPSASTQAPYIEGIKNYIKYVNENGGVNGRKFDLNVQDDQFKVDKALAAYQRLIDNGTFAILGQGGSSQYAAYDKNIKEDKIPLFGAMQATAAQENNPYVYDMNLSPMVMSKIFVQRVLDSYKGTGKPKIAVFFYDVAMGYELQQAFVEVAKQGKVEIVLSEPVAVAAKDATAQVTKVKNAKADATVIFSTLDFYMAFLRDAQKLGASDMPVLATFGGVSPPVWETVGKDASKNYSGLQCYNPYYSQGTGLELLRQVAEKYGVSKPNLENVAYVQGWTTALVFVEAVKRAGKDLTREGLITAIEGLANFDTGGLSSPITFGSGQHFGIRSGRFYSYNFDTKQIQPISDYYKAQ